MSPNVDTVRLLDGERDGPGHRVRRDRDPLHFLKGLRPHLRNRHGFCELLAPLHVRAGPGGFTAGLSDTGSQGLKTLRPACSEDDLRAALGKQKRSRLADAAAAPVIATTLPSIPNTIDCPSIKDDGSHVPQ
jgi:hypothetical protein